MKLIDGKRKKDGIWQLIPLWRKQKLLVEGDHGQTGMKDMKIWEMRNTGNEDETGD